MGPGIVGSKLLAIFWASAFPDGATAPVFSGFSSQDLRNRASSSRSISLFGLRTANGRDGDRATRADSGRAGVRPSRASYSHLDAIVTRQSHSKAVLTVESARPCLRTATVHGNCQQRGSKEHAAIERMSPVRKSEASGCPGSPSRVSADAVAGDDAPAAAGHQAAAALHRRAGELRRGRARAQPSAGAARRSRRRSDRAGRDTHGVLWNRFRGRLGERRTAHGPRRHRERHRHRPLERLSGRRGRAAGLAPPAGRSHAAEPRRVPRLAGRRLRWRRPGPRGPRRRRPVAA